MATEYQINEALPVRVDGLGVNDPLFWVYSAEPNWGLAVSCEWRLVGPGVDHSPNWASVDDDPLFETTLRSLIGRDLKRISMNEDRLDPVFYFDGGFTLSLFARKHSEHEQFTLDLPGFGTIIGYSAAPAETE